MQSRFEDAIQRVENASKRGFSFKYGRHIVGYFDDEVKELNELNRRYIKLYKLFVNMGFCEMCPVHIQCERAGVRCERMLEWWLSKGT